MSQSLPRAGLPLRAGLAGSLERDWNEVLPRLYEKPSTPAAWMIGMHFFAGSAGGGGVTYLLSKARWAA